MNETIPSSAAQPPITPPVSEQGGSAKLAEAWDKIRELRKRLDLRDTAMAEILCERFELVSAIGQIKKDYGINVKDPAREAEQLTRLGQIAFKQDVPREFMTATFQMIFRVSRTVQRGIPDPNEPIEPRICPSCGIRSCGEPSPNLVCRRCPACKEVFIF